MAALRKYTENIEIIKSSNVGLMQHDAVSWGVMGDSFLKVDNREKSMVKIDKTLKKWVEGLSDSEREKFIDILFSTLERAQIYDIDILSAMPADKLISLIKAYDELSTDSKKYIKRTVKLLVDTWVDLTKKNIQVSHRETCAPDSVCASRQISFPNPCASSRSVYLSWRLDPD